MNTSELNRLGSVKALQSKSCRSVLMTKTGAGMTLRTSDILTLFTGEADLLLSCWKLLTPQAPEWQCSVQNVVLCAGGLHSLRVVETEQVEDVILFAAGEDQAVVLH